MKKFLLSITADTNDADYVTEATEVTEATLNKLKPVFKRIKNFKPYVGFSEAANGCSKMKWTHKHNWPYGHGDYSPREDLGEKHPIDIYKGITEEEVELFNDHAPHGEYGIHTIKNITVYEFTGKKKYL